MTVTAPADVDAAIAERLRRGQSVEQLCAVGARTGWWSEDDVDRVAGAADGEPEELAEEAAEDERLEVLTGQLRADGAIAPARPPAEDVLAMGLAHPTRRVRQLAAAARDAVDELVTALMGGGPRG
ncbi:hypothetical protein [Blastococcus xanthinilyticus]|uniref:Uncharacterized protein n=1 Tax=Blastococcus xanthinilyticus TaxID=1564164 RepID=A0A5S5CMA7_9ACTN|nr:hypothetical protein [Blastococcus xanthinilyticus]TYP82052.1 hypothetical protein BD833_12036 [Blastococcus xanthinilyticus]